MELIDFLKLFKTSVHAKETKQLIDNSETRISLKGLIGSASTLFSSAILEELDAPSVFILKDKETAAYFYNDLENIFNERTEPVEKKKILFFPASFKKPYDIEKTENANILMRAEVLTRYNKGNSIFACVTYPEALAEKVVGKNFFAENTLKLHVNENVDIDFVLELLLEYNFERVDFVIEPGQFSIRGGIIDTFSFSNDLPYRIEFNGNIVESIRSFNPASQLSIEYLQEISIIPSVQNIEVKQEKISFLEYINKKTFIWIKDIENTGIVIESELQKAEKIYNEANFKFKHLLPNQLYCNKENFIRDILLFRIIEFGNSFYFEDSKQVLFNQLPQPVFNKNFDLLYANLQENTEHKLKNVLISDNPKQIDRIHAIIDDLQTKSKSKSPVYISSIPINLHEGFIDTDYSIACYTDHQIFERYHRFHLRDQFSSKEALTLREFYNLKPGDYVTHIDHGIGKFAGLEKILINGKEQEALRLVYKENDILYVSIHSLHRISKYSGGEGVEPTLNKLGSAAWTNLKNKTKQKVKDIAKDLIKLYAERKTKQGFQFSPDTYMQYELEASFIYEDTPDQVKATADVKKDMEMENPMDRLICGDVGFGKTEIAIRAAFKAVADSKQVAILVPTTILAFQHYKTFSDRLKNMPCKIDYINRFKTTKQQHATLKSLEEGKVDILIGTHRLLGKDIIFKDLGLLIVDEEQKFGVAAKEKLKQIKVNVDTLTLTATPIPRTLQFSLMGARDLSIIKTPPPNRYPVQTEVLTFSEEAIRDAIMYEVNRGGQIFFVHNRVQNIHEIASKIQRLCPSVRVAIGHGQMDGAKLEDVMLSFIEDEYDVLIATTIIETGLDIPNANTIIINDAQNFGLSDLHQLRGRVGRSNKKAFCYLIIPPATILSDEARKRLKAIEEFSDLGSGFNIAMRDLDIRGAGNLLGGEQSGFITDIGYEMYHKILDEAIQELKSSDFKECFGTEPEKDFASDCIIETDMEILIPTDYITNIAERLNIYKDLDNIEEEKALTDYTNTIIDRFGPLPNQTLELLSTIRLRWIAKKTGFEKLVLKHGKLIGYFINNQNASYFNSETFSKILIYVQKNPKHCKLKEVNNKLTITFENIKKVSEAIDTIQILTL